MAKFKSGSFQENTFTTSQLNALTKANYIGRLVYDSTVGSQAYTDGTNWIYIRPINDLTTGGTARSISAAQGKVIGDRVAAMENILSPTGLSGTQKIYYPSREEFLTALSGTPGLGATLAASYSEFQFDRYYSSGPNIALEYVKTTSDPTASDPTAITLVAGSTWLTQRFAAWGAHADQFGFLYDTTDESTRWANAIGSSLVRGIELPPGKVISSSVRLYVPDDKFVICKSAYGGFRARANMTAVLTLGTRSHVKNIEIDGSGWAATGILVPTTSSTVNIEDCSVRDLVTANDPATSGDGFLIQGLLVRMVRCTTSRVKIAYRVNRAQRLIAENLRSIQAVSGIVCTDSTDVSFKTGTIVSCSETGVLFEGGSNCEVAGFTISRCKNGEIAFARNPTNLTVTGSANLAVRNCVVIRDVNYVNLAGGTTSSDGTKGAIQVNGMDVGSFGCGVFSSHFTINIGRCWMYAEAGTSALPEFDRPFRIEDNHFRHALSAPLFMIASRAQQLFHNRNTYYITTGVSTSSEWKNANRSEFIKNRFICATNPNVALIHFLTTEAATSHVASNIFQNTLALAGKVTQNRAWDITFQRNLFSSEYVVWGGLENMNTQPPRFIDQRLFIKMTRTTAGTSETVNLYDATDFNNLFRSGVGSIHGATGQIVLAAYSDTASVANMYNLTLSGTPVPDSISIETGGFGSGSGFSKSTGLYIASAPTSATVTLTKPNNASMTIEATAILTTIDSYPQEWTTDRLGGSLVADIDPLRREFIRLTGSNVNQIITGSYSASQGTSASQPTYNPTGFNTSYPAIVCATTGKFMPTNIPQPTGAVSVFAAVSCNVVNGTSSDIIISGSQDGGVAFFMENGAMVLTKSNQVRIAQTATGLVPANTPAMVGVTYNNSTAKFYLNGTLVATVNASSTFTAGRVTTLFRDLPTANTLQDFDGALGRLIITFGVVADADIDRIFGEMAHKLGMAGSLPADHPYKTAPPKI